MNIFFLQVRTDSLNHSFTGKVYHWLEYTGPKILIGVIIFFLGQVVIKFLNKGFKRILSARRFDATLKPFVENLVQIALQVLLLLFIMQLLNIKMTLFAAFIGALGVAIGLALSGTLQNFASGVLIIMLKPFRVGDNIQTQGEEGTVTSIRLFYSIIRTYTNTTLIVPNSKLSNEVIFNLTREDKRRIDVNLKFKYDVDFNRLQDILQQAVTDSDDYLKEPAYRIGIEKVETDGYTVSLNVWVNSHGYHDTRLKLNKRLMEDLKTIFLPPKNV
jgi:small conductance mechanosensitive channel